MFRLAAAVFLQNRLAVIGLAVLVLLVGFCFIGPLLYHTDQVNVNLANAALRPGPGHPLGTDETGYDELGRLMVGGRVSLTIGLAAAVIATLVGTLWGAVAGFVGGVVDAVLMRVVDALL